MKKLFFIPLIFCFIHFSIAQRCGHVQHMNELYQKYPKLKNHYDSLNSKIDSYLLKEKLSKNVFKNTKTAAEVIYEIPVVVHVIYNNYFNAVTNISDAQIYSQIDILNQDYSRTNPDTNQTYSIYKNRAANTGIRFCMASVDPDGAPTNGIVRVYNSRTAFNISEMAAVANLSRWPSDQYLNIWVCNIAAPFLGVGQFPSDSELDGLFDDEGGASTDGVMIGYKYFGTTGAAVAPYNGGRTTTHEVGHWLGLLHIFGDVSCGDDYVSDTPLQSEENLGDCDLSYSSCAGPTTVDMIQNYMDYSDDACMNLFTEGQKDRMRAAMQVSPRRLALLNSSGCCPPEDKVQIPLVVDFENNDYGDRWQNLNFDAASPYSQTWSRVSPGAYGQSNYAFKIENDSVYTATDSTYWDVFQSPTLDLSKSEKNVLEFDLAYARGTMGTATDSLVIYYNLGCKDIWIPCKVYYGNDLVTTARQTNDFTPSIDEWKRIKLDLYILAGKRSAKFRIAVFSKGINPLYIDNINFYKESQEIQLNLYPVPAQGEVNVEVIFSGNKDVKIEMFDSLGKRLFEIEKKNSTSFVELVNLTGIGSGAYIVRIISEGNKKTKRMLVF